LQRNKSEVQVKVPTGKQNILKMIILGKNTSINVRKVWWSCAEIGVSYQLEPSCGTDVQHLNPHAMVPVLADAGEVLWE
jgi:glutathione S-transferase